MENNETSTPTPERKIAAVRDTASVMASGGARRARRRRARVSRELTHAEVSGRCGRPAADASSSKSRYVLRCSITSRADFALRPPVVTAGEGMDEWDLDEGWDEAELAEIDALEQQAVLGESVAGSC
jgi:hypothetical protein